MESSNLDVKLNNPIYMPLNSSITQKFESMSYLFGKGTARLLETMNTLSPYFNENRSTKEITPMNYSDHIIINGRI